MESKATEHAKYVVVAKEHLLLTSPLVDVSIILIEIS